MATVAGCGMCATEVKKLDAALLCEGLCEKWFHISCVGITENTYTLLQIESERKWYCPTCNSEPFMDICKEMKELQYFLSSLSGRVSLDTLKRIPKKLKKFRANIACETSKFVVNENEKCRSISIKTEQSPSEHKTDFSDFDLKWSECNLVLPVTKNEDVDLTDGKSKLTLPSNSNLSGADKKLRPRRTSQSSLDKTDISRTTENTETCKAMEHTENLPTDDTTEDKQQSKSEAAEAVVPKQPQQQEQQKQQQPVVKAPNAKSPNDVYEVEDILDYMKIHGKSLFLVKWKNYGHEYNTWENKVNLGGCKRLIKEYFRRSLYNFEKMMEECKGMERLERSEDKE